jgi:hypothetical protein
MANLTITATVDDADLERFSGPGGKLAGLVVGEVGQYVGGALAGDRRRGQALVSRRSGAGATAGHDPALRVSRVARLGCGTGGLVELDALDVVHAEQAQALVPATRPGEEVDDHRLSSASERTNHTPVMNPVENVTRMVPTTTAHISVPTLGLRAGLRGWCRAGGVPGRSSA